MSYPAASILAGCLFLLFGIGLGLASVVTSEWLEHTVGAITQTAGLWRVCIDGNCENHSRTDPLDASRALMLLGLILAGISLLASIIDFGHLAVNKPIARSVDIFIAVLALLAVACTVVGIVVFQTKVWDDLAPSGAIRGYSSWLAVASVGSYTVGCLFLLIRFCFRGQDHMKNEDDQKDAAIRAFEMERERERERQEEREVELERERVLEQDRRNRNQRKSNQYDALDARRHSSRKERAGGREYRDFPAYVESSGAYPRYIMPAENPAYSAAGYPDPRIHGGYPDPRIHGGYPDPRIQGGPVIYDDGFRAHPPTRRSTGSLPIQNIMYRDYRHPLY